MDPRLATNTGTPPVAGALRSVASCRSPGEAVTKPNPPPCKSGLGRGEGGRAPAPAPARGRAVMKRPKLPKERLRGEGRPPEEAPEGSATDNFFGLRFCRGARETGVRDTCVGSGVAPWRTTARCIP